MSSGTSSCRHTTSTGCARRNAATLARCLDRSILMHASARADPPAVMRGLLDGWHVQRPGARLRRESPSRDDRGMGTLRSKAGRAGGRNEAASRGRAVAPGIDQATGSMIRAAVLLDGAPSIPAGSSVRSRDDTAGSFLALRGRWRPPGADPTPSHARSARRGYGWPPCRPAARRSSRSSRVSRNEDHG